MTMKYYECELGVLTPTFVGSGEKIGKIEYYEQEGSIYFLNEAKWIEFLAEAGIMDDFAGALGKNDLQSYSLNDYLNQNNALKARLRTSNILGKLQQFGVVKDGVPIEPEGRYRCNDLSTFACDAFGRRALPGSSIKGAIRTAILSCYLNRQQEEYQRVWQRLESIAQKGYQVKDDIEKAIKQLEEELTMPINPRRGKCEMVDSYFRGLQISDASLIVEEAAIVKKLDLGIEAARERKAPHGVALYRECLVPASRAVFTIGIDGDILGKLGIFTIDDLLTVLRSFVDFQYYLVCDLFEGEAGAVLNQMLKAQLVLGGGTGFISKTLIYALAPERKAGVKVVRAVLADQRAFQKHHHERDTDLSPHTLKFTRYRGREQLMGLCSVKVVREL